MHAHKIKLNIPSDHRVSFELPGDFPQGEAEVIVLAPIPVAVPRVGLDRGEEPEAAGAEFSRCLNDLLDRLPTAPLLPDAAFDRAAIYED